MRKLLAAAAVALVAARSAAQPLSRQQLLELVEKGVGEDLVRSLVACACVDFAVDEASLDELRRALPPTVLAAVIDCQGGAASQSEREETSRPTPAAIPDSAPLAAPAPRLATPAALGVVAVPPIVLDGKPDPDLTAYLIEQTRARRPAWTLLDAPATGDAARGLGAQALFADQGQTGTNAMGATEVVLELRLVAVDGGALLWSASGGSEGGALTRKHAARLAVRAALKKLPE